MKNYINIIITMAGIGSRFRKAGYNCPKYMIEVNGRTLFELSLDSLVGYNKCVNKYVFVLRKEDNAVNFVTEICHSRGIENIELLELDYQTDGQATTCMEALRLCEDECGILIYNIDTYVEPEMLKLSDLEGDGHIPCFHADGIHWSFVKMNEEGLAVEVREKERISDNCTIGAYYFSSAALYKKLYNEYYKENINLVNNEKYVAPLYNYLIQSGGNVTISIIDDTKVHVLGTPEEVAAYIESINKSL